jgi:hypothetical protein
MYFMAFLPTPSTAEREILRFAQDDGRVMLAFEGGFETRPYDPFSRGFRRRKASRRHPESAAADEGSLFGRGDMAMRPN